MRALINAGSTNMKPETRHSFVSVDGMRLHWAESGEASQRVPVVLLHGLNDSYLSWKRVAPARMPYVRVWIASTVGSSAGPMAPSTSSTHP